mmetsp:Transcript_11752/g.31707  ORF Transcript_11752/g.31707 Transcript_11752/m.31707 type:complete len:514 (-) Transcript_11752:898-2439(-)
MASLAAAEEPSGVPDRDKFARADGGKKDLEADSDEKMKIFENWLLDNNSKFPKLVMQKYDDEVRGVHAAEEIGPDESIIEIPLECLITVEMGKATDIGRAVLQSDLDLDAPKHVFLMLFMLIDRKNPTSHFKPYYDTLPPTLSNMPIFWSQEELALLEGSYLLVQVEERNTAIENDYKAICHLCPDFADISTLDEFKWARMCVCSRNFGIVVDGVRTSAMVPYADMLNHYRPRETKWTYENHKRAFTITTLQSISVGAQVYDSYGQKCNHRFLLNYGFAIENNCEPDGFCPNEVPFKFDLPWQDEIFDAKSAFWVRDGHGKLIRVCVSDNENTSFAFACLRVMVATKEEFQALSGAGGTGAVALPHTVKDIRFPMSLRNEKAALTMFMGMINDKLAAYPRSLEEDKVLLAGDSLTPFSNERHAVIQVAGEKEVLEHYKTHCQVALELLSFDVNDDAAYIARHRELRDSGCSPWILKYCSLDPMGTIGMCRRMERRRLQQAQEGTSDPARPHIV